MTMRYRSNSVRAVQQRIKNLPSRIDKVVDAPIMRDAQAFIQFYQDGLRTNSLQLKALKPATVAAKSRQGMPAPRSPLYGKGISTKNSLANVFRVVKIKRGWRVRPRSAKHWSAAMSIQDLLNIHEKGAVIRRVTKSGKTVVITIPPRPAVAKAWMKYLRQRNLEEISDVVRREINRLMLGK